MTEFQTRTIVMDPAKVVALLIVTDETVEGGSNLEGNWQFEVETTLDREDLAAVLRNYATALVKGDSAMEWDDRETQG